MTTIVLTNEDEDGDGSGSVLMTLPDIQLSDFRESDIRRKKQHRNIYAAKSNVIPNVAMKNLKKDEVF